MQVRVTCYGKSVTKLLPGGWVLNRVFCNGYFYQKKRGLSVRGLTSKKKYTNNHEHAALAHAAHLARGDTRVISTPAQSWAWCHVAGAAAGRWGLAASRRTGMSDCWRKNCGNSIRTLPTGSCPRVGGCGTRPGGPGRDPGRPGPPAHHRGAPPRPPPTTPRT